MATLASPDTMRDPFDYYRFMRENDPVHYDEQAGAYLISRYEDVQKALRLTDVFSSELGFSLVRKPEYQQEVDEFMQREGFGPFVLNFTVDPPEHTRRRALVDQAFSARRVTGMEGYMHAVVNELIDAFINRGEAELVSELAIPIPVFVIADALGVPPRPDRRFSHLVGGRRCQFVQPGVQPRAGPGKRAAPGGHAALPDRRDRGPARQPA